MYVCAPFANSALRGEKGALGHLELELHSDGCEWPCEEGQALKAQSSENLTSALGTESSLHSLQQLSYCLYHVHFCCHSGSWN